MIAFRENKQHIKRFFKSCGIKQAFLATNGIIPLMLTELFQESKVYDNLVRSTRITNPPYFRMQIR